MPRYNVEPVDCKEEQHFVNISWYGTEKYGHFQLITGGGIFPNMVTNTAIISYVPHVINYTKSDFIPLSDLSKNEQELIKIDNDIANLKIIKNMVSEDIESYKIKEIFSEHHQTETIFNENLQKLRKYINDTLKPYDYKINYLNEQKESLNNINKIISDTENDLINDKISLQLLIDDTTESIREIMKSTDDEKNIKLIINSTLRDHKDINFSKDIIKRMENILEYAIKLN